MDTASARLARALLAQAEQDEDAAFNAQHALARESERAVAAITAAGDEHHRRDELARRRAEDDAARYDPEELADAPPGAAPRPGPRAGRADEDEEDEVPGHWLH